MQAVAAEQSGYAEIFYCFLEREEHRLIGGKARFR